MALNVVESGKKTRVCNRRRNSFLFQHAAAIESEKLSLNAPCSHQMRVMACPRPATAASNAIVLQCGCYNFNDRMAQCQSSRTSSFQCWLLRAITMISTWFSSGDYQFKIASLSSQTISSTIQWKACHPIFMHDSQLYW